MTYSLKQNARVAGVLYLLMGLTGAFGIMYVPSQIFVWDNATTTAQNILAQESLFRLGILSQLASQVLFIFLVLSLYRLLKNVNESYAKQLVALVFVGVPIGFLNMLNQLAALILLSDADFLKPFDPEQITALTMTFLKLYEQGITIVQVFWGLWLIPFGLLVYRSAFIPRILGIILVVGGVGYVLSSITGVMWPSLMGTVAPIVTIPSAIGEFGIIFWLLIKGVRERK